MKIIDHVPEVQVYPCACGCGENVTYDGYGRKPRYVNNAHKQKAYRMAKQ